MSSALLWACALLLVPVSGQLTTCSTSVNDSYGQVRCHFGLDVNKTKYGFRLELQPENHPDTEPLYALVCLWNQEILHCKNHIGFIFDHQQVSEFLTLQINNPASYEGFYLCRLVPAYGDVKRCTFKMPVIATASPPLHTATPCPSQRATTYPCSTDRQDRNHITTNSGGDSSETSLTTAVIILSIILAVLFLILCICGFVLRRRKKEKFLFPWKNPLLNRTMINILRWLGLKYTTATNDTVTGKSNHNVDVPDIRANDQEAALLVSADRSSTKARNGAEVQPELSQK